MIEEMDGQVSWSDPDLWCGRMLLEPCQVQEKTKEEKTSNPYSRRSSASQNPMLPMCLCLKRDGESADVSTMRWGGGQLLGRFTMPSGGAAHKDADGLLWLQISTDSQLPRLYLTLNIGEKPRKTIESKLSDILEEDADPNYTLSEKACKGILRRAERRGKKLPDILKHALESQIDS